MLTPRGVSSDSLSSSLVCSGSLRFVSSFTGRRVSGWPSLGCAPSGTDRYSVGCGMTSAMALALGGNPLSLELWVLVEMIGLSM